MSAGRPTDYTEDLARRFALHLAELGAVAKVCALEGMPARATVYDWMRAQPGFQAMIDLAREEYADTIFDELDAIVNEKPPTDEGGRVDHGWVRDKEVRVKAIHWKLARLAPRRFAERRAMELTGAEGAPLIPSQEISPERLLEGARRLAYVLHRADQLQKASAPVLQLVHEARPAPAQPDPPASPPPKLQAEEVDPRRWDETFDGGAAEHGWPQGRKLRDR